MKYFKSNKKYLLLVILFFIFLSGNIMLAEAATGDFSALRVPALCNAKECGWQELMALGGELLRFAIFIAILGATIAFAFAGFKLITNQGDSGAISKAKEMMIKAAIGIVVTMTAWIIVSFILNKLGVQGLFRFFV